VARNGENLFRRNGERYWRFKYKTLDGRYREQSTGKERKSEARLVRDEHLARCRAGQMPNDMKTWLLSRAVEERLSLRKVQRPKSYRIEKTCLRAVMRVFGPGKRLDSITNLDIERYQVARLKMKKERGKGSLRPATVNLEILYLAQLLKRAKLWWRLEDDYQPLPESKSGIGRAITLDQFAGLLKIALTHPEWEVAFYATVISACAAGLRGIEIKKLRLENCRLSKDEAWLTIPRDATKSDAGCREIPLNGPGRWRWNDCSSVRRLQVQVRPDTSCFRRTGQSICGQTIPARANAAMTPLIISPVGGRHGTAFAQKQAFPPFDSTTCAIYLSHKRPKPTFLCWLQNLLWATCRLR
jgi:hypothetical protein